MNGRAARSYSGVASLTALSAVAISEPRFRIFVLFRQGFQQIAFIFFLSFFFSSTVDKSLGSATVLRKIRWNPKFTGSKQRVRTTKERICPADKPKTGIHSS
ncbi:hypothetical protein RvY_06982 [Ramazzottius varieornatus]|uniref:Uncharacterized protein n=1 Tax=Ramazzottius varieornatus TaxID=947166 RepID=A0A1D1V0T2_RAMVA|nr:hypothetical protein RvY_06982 [Ramazzottius varieornatus]